MLPRPPTKWRQGQHPQLTHNTLMILSNGLSRIEKSSFESQICVSLLSVINGGLLEITRKKDLNKQVYATNICNPSRWLNALILCQLYLKRLCEAQSCPLVMERARNAGNKQIFTKNYSLSIGWDWSVVLKWLFSHYISHRNPKVSRGY